MKTSFGNQWKKVSALMMRLSFGNQWKNSIEVSALIRRKSNQTTQDPNLSSSLELKKPNSISILKNPMEVSASKHKGYEADGYVRGKAIQEKGGATAKGLNTKASPAVANTSGSRFDILKDDADVTMMDSGGQTSCKSTAEGKKGDKVVRVDITNKTPTNKAAAKTPSQTSKKLNKKGKKVVSVVLPQHDIRRGVEYYKKSFGLNTESDVETLTLCERDPKELDNADVLRQLHRDVSNFESGVSSSSVVGDNPSSSTVLTVDSFDQVASTLEGAMAGISE
ncbi:hypothetical protein LWI29_024306 [Acer saccharum]|uniref:Uncharacterized protein n=1 Tax=Acer saccharum TaxID=4024 RepID=A0AA39SLT4_ACESA|nr:hypothetical protein LWI29_024306 [Acer saccharum]